MDMCEQVVHEGSYARVYVHIQSTLRILMKLRTLRRMGHGRILILVPIVPKL